MEPSEVAARVLAAVDTQRAVDLTRQVCRIPSILGAEGDLADFLAASMRDRDFSNVELQPVLPDRPNAIG
ncbi:MAG: hypothetical protein F4Z34_00175, partial [Acidimicrobiaceae bacterium]|nr:hypothetical protein [Acidimicrobiaceae bacterium]